MKAIEGELISGEKMSWILYILLGFQGRASKIEFTLYKGLILRLLKGVPRKQNAAHTLYNAYTFLINYIN